MDQMMASVMIFAGNFAPRGWAYCDGQLMAINQFQALFSLLGTTYGGDGRTTFALPDLRGRAALGPRHGPGLSQYSLGERGGVEEVYLNVLQIPSHNHSPALNVSNANASISQPTPGSSIAAPGSNDGRTFSNTLGFTADAPNVRMSSGSIVESNVGGSQGHTNMQPFLAINYIIAIEGIFPSRS